MKVYFPKGFSNSNLSVSLGEFEYDTDNHSAVWKINKIDKENNIVLKGNLSNNTSNNLFGNCVLNMRCTIDKFSVSGGRVTKVTITKNTKNHNVYKGEKSKTFVKNLEMIF